MRLAVVTNILGPSRLPLFEAMDRLVEGFAVLLMAQNEENREWRLGQARFRTEVLPGFHVGGNGSRPSLHLNYGVIAALRRFRPDVVLSGGFAPANLAAFLYCRLHRKLNVPWAHLTLKDGAERFLFRRLLRRLMIGGSAGCIGESSEASDAFVHYGAERTRVLTALNPIDTAHFHEGAARYRRQPEWKEMRARFRGPVLLSIGQLIPRKGCEQLFRIYERLLHSIAPVTLLILGDGPGRAGYEQLVRDRGWTDVHFGGYVQSGEVPRYLALADVFVFHTLYDPYGLVLAEAMAAELPVVSSIHASATRDLVVEGVTGFRIDPLKADESAAVVAGALRMSETERRAMGKAAYERVRVSDVRVCADAIIRFLHSLGGAPCA